MLFFKTLSTFTLIAPFVFVVAVLLSFLYGKNIPLWYDYLLRFLLGIVVVSILLCSGFGLFYAVVMIWS
ncbi:Uncharacterised protein [Acinetobacter phage MD-2021a]|nr:Uncharacterised protein [Acinetobacter phage MD-2021a]CAH1089063.1 Uncharacterised protein [Acinetobacter phage MD-2021a]